MDPIALAAIILKTTGLGGWIEDKLGGVISPPVANKVVAIAQAVTNVADPAALAASPALQDPVVISNLKEKLVDNEQEIIRLMFADTADARLTYRSSDHKMADDIARKIMDWNIWIIMLMVIANSLVVYFVKEPTITLAVGNLIGGAINNMWTERQTVTGFYLGSSIGSKIKDRAQ